MLETVQYLNGLGEDWNEGLFIETMGSSINRIHSSLFPCMLSFLSVSLVSSLVSILIHSGLDHLSLHGTHII